MQTVNLEEILDRIYDDNYRSNFKTEYSKKCILEAMREACKQALELAVNNIDSEDCFAYSSERNRYDRIEESITNTINQVV